MYTVPLRGADDPVGGRMLQEVLQAFSERYQVLFSFDADLVRGVEVNFEFRDEESFDDAINRLLSTTSLQYKSLGSKYYVIYRSDRQGHRTLRRLERKINQIQALEAGGQVSLQPTVQSMSRRAGLIGAAVLQMVGKRITGTVRDDEGNPLVGATVRVQGYNVGAITDEAGNFAIDAPDEATTLLVSYIGFDIQVIELAGRTAVEVVMQLSNNSLDEVVVIGFGSQKRQDLTGAIASVDGDILNEMPVSSMEQALAGRLAGVQVMSGSGVPGAGASIRVRGRGGVAQQR
ncbi:MAG: hypothetical protein OHK0039_43620 [Bacteroidia bacterium]